MITLDHVLSVVATATALGQLALSYSRARSSGKSSRAIRMLERKAVEYGIPAVGIATCTASLVVFVHSERPPTRLDVLAIALLCSCIGLQLVLFLLVRFHRLLAAAGRRPAEPSRRGGLGADPEAPGRRLAA